MGTARGRWAAAVPRSRTALAASIALITACALGVSVAPASAMNPIQAENGKQGDALWQVGIDSSTQTPDNRLNGYATRVSVAPGERIDFAVSSYYRYRVTIE